MNTTPRSTSAVGKVLVFIVGMVIAMVAITAALSGGDDTAAVDQTGSGSVFSGGDAGGPRPGTSFYDGGSITTGDDGELIYSDTDGNGFSSGESFSSEG